MKRAVFFVSAPPHSPPPSASINVIRLTRRQPLRQPSSVQAAAVSSTSVNRVARRHPLRQPSPVQPAVICINQRHTIRSSSSISTTIVRSGIVARINQRQPSRPPSSAPTTVVRSGHCHLLRPTSTESPSVIRSDNHRSFKPSSPASINVNRVARRPSLQQPSSVQAAVARINQRQPSRAPSTAPTTIVRSGIVARINQCHTTHLSSSAPTAVIRSSRCRPHQSASTESRVVSCSGRRHLLRSTPSIRLPPCASSNIIRFTRRPSRRLPAAPLGHFFHMGVGGATASGKIGCGEGGGCAVRFLRDFALFLQKCAENRAFDRIRSGRIGCFVRPAAPA